MNKKIFSLIMSATIATSSFAGNNSNEVKKEAGRTSFFEKSGLDNSISPADDFFNYANGGWLKSVKIPDDQKGWGSFMIVKENNVNNLHGLVAELAAKNNLPKGSLEQKVGDYFASGMDTVAIENAGVSPIKPGLAKIDKINSVDEMLNYATMEMKNGGGALFGFYVGADEKNSNSNIANLVQAETSLPEKSYYTDSDERAKKIREEFLKYASTLFSLAGESTDKASVDAQTILEVETKIAASHRSKVELRDPQKNYNKFFVRDLPVLISDKIEWNRVFDNIGVKIDSVNIGQPDYYKALGNLLTAIPLADWKTKLKFNYISGHAGTLNKPFRDAQFNFYSKTLNGQKVEQPRWKQMTNSVDGNLGELAGQLYVKKYFTDNAKKRMDELVSNIITAYKIRLQKLDWMSNETKAKAEEKLAAIMRKVGYPSKWKNYEDVTIDRNNYFANHESISKHEFNEMIKKLGKPVDKTEWGMTPPTVNAYYNPSYNEIVFPAGILQFPFFDENADDAINYGGIGMVIGHEITHGFDDQGCQYDAQGNMKNWWTKDDAEKFAAKTKGLVDQYSACTILDGLHVNGELTLGENIADFGGIAIAYDAYKMTKQGQGNEKIDGFTGDQRFFLGFAQVWRVIKRDELMRMSIKTDPHSPAMYRVNVPLMNFDPFYKAFGVKEGNKMFRKSEDRARVW